MTNDRCVGGSDQIPKERDRATGESGDLGVWPDDVELNPAEVWEGEKAVFSYMTHSHLGEHFEEGDGIAVIFHDRALLCTVEEVVTDDTKDTGNEQ